MSEHLLKTAKTYEEQISILKERNINIEDDNEAIDFLKKVNYYRATGYLYPFRIGDKVYAPGLNFSRLIEIYEFDSQIRNIFSSIITEIEVFLRTQVAYLYAHKYGAEINEEHLSFKNNKELDSFFNKINEVLEKNKNNPIVKHHIKYYGGKYPIWVLVEFFSMGTLSSFYRALPKEDRKKMCLDSYGFYAESLTDSWFKCFVELRNKVCHQGRLFNSKFPSIPQKPLPSSLDTTDNLLFTQILLLKYMYPNKDKWNQLYKESFEKLIGYYFGEGIIEREHIGLPAGWKEQLIKK